MERTRLENRTDCEGRKKSFGVCPPGAIGFPSIIFPELEVPATQNAALLCQKSYQYSYNQYILAKYFGPFVRLPEGRNPAVILGDLVQNHSEFRKPVKVDG